MRRLLIVLWAAAFVAVLAMYYIHLRADFPNYSPWSDWAKFTDEGWYGDAAIRHVLFGRWDVPGDFNPAAALPVLPFFEWIVFHFAGVSLEAARALSVTFFAGSLAGVFLLVKRYHSPIVAGLAVTLLVVNPLNFTYARLAILEPPLIFFFMLLLLACSHAQWRRWNSLIMAGVLLIAVLLTKTTGLFLAPAAIYLLWRSNHRETGRWLRCIVVVSAVAGVLACMYAALVIGTHHAADFRYLFKADATVPLTLHSRWDALRGAVAEGMCMDQWLYPTACVAIVFSTFRMRRLWRDPLFGACVWWIAGYVAFIGWHANLQARYYVPVAPAVVILLCIVLEYGWRTRKRLLTAGLLLVMAVAILHDARMTLRWAMHPEYSYWNAAQAVAEKIKNDPQPNHLLMSISGSQITLMTGVRSICDDFGTEDLEARLPHYNPGWYASWDDIDVGTLDSLQHLYLVQWVGAWPAMDDPTRRVLTLWRLVPLPPSAVRKDGP